MTEPTTPEQRADAILHRVSVAYEVTGDTSNLRATIADAIRAAGREAAARALQDVAVLAVAIAGAMGSGAVGLHVRDGILARAANILEGKADV